MSEEVKKDIAKQEAGGMPSVEIISEQQQESREHVQTFDQEEIKTARQKIEAMDIDDTQHFAARSHAAKVTSLKEDQQITELLQTAKRKGVVFAVKVAQKIGNPFILDALHDTLAANGHYKEFLK